MEVKPSSTLKNFTVVFHGIKFGVYVAWMKEGKEQVCVYEHAVGNRWQNPLNN